MSEQHLDDGWYRTVSSKGEIDFERVVDDRVDYGTGATVGECIEWGWLFEPAVCMTQVEYDGLQQRIAELEAQLAERGNDVDQ